MIKDVYPYKIFNEIVTAFTTNTCYFKYGYWPEISANIMENKKDTTLRDAQFPFIMVSAGYKEYKQQTVNDYVDVDIDLYIVGQSQKNYTTIEREENIYQAVLNPIYNELIEAMLDSTYFIRDDNKLLPHEKTNLYYLRNMGTDQNALNDFVDVIELKFSRLRIRYKNTCTALEMHSS